MLLLALNMVSNTSDSLWVGLVLKVAMANFAKYWGGLVDIGLQTRPSIKNDGTEYRYAEDVYKQHRKLA